MKLKPGVDIKGLHITMRDVLVAANAIWKAHDQELVITRGMETLEDNWAGSYHPFGRAVDLRIHYFDDDLEREEVAEELKTALSRYYSVVLKPTHIHVEYRGLA